MKPQANHRGTWRGGLQSSGLKSEFSRRRCTRCRSHGGSDWIAQTGRPVKHSIVVYLASQDRRASESMVDKSIIFCESPRELTAIALNKPVSVIVIDADALMRASIEPEDIVGRCAATAPTVLRTMLTSALLSRIRQFAAVAPDVTVSITHRESLVALLRNAADAGAAPSAQLMLASRLSSLRSDAASTILASAALLGNRRTSVNELARLCGLATRTLEWRLAASARPTARTVLGWMTVLHAVWRMEILGWSPKRAASEGGFASGELFAAYVKRHTGVRPTALARGGFTLVLQKAELAMIGAQEANHGAAGHGPLHSCLDHH